MTDKEKRDKAVDAFAVRMKARLDEKAAEGYSGWDGAYPWAPLCGEIITDATTLGPGIVGPAEEHLPVDIGTRAMMLWFRIHGQEEQPPKREKGFWRWWPGVVRLITAPMRKDGAQGVDGAYRWRVNVGGYWWQQDNNRYMLAPPEPTPDQIPGYKVVDFRPPNKDDAYWMRQGGIGRITNDFKWTDGPRYILAKIEPEKREVKYPVMPYGSSGYYVICHKISHELTPIYKCSAMIGFKEFEFADGGRSVTKMVRERLVGHGLPYIPTGHTEVCKYVVFEEQP